MRRKIKLFTSKIHEESIKGAENVLRSGWLETGPITDKFEQRFKEMNQTTTSPLLVTSGTAALHLAYVLAKKHTTNRDRRWFTTPNTFIATNTALIQAGLEPVWVDIDLNTGNMDLDDLDRKVCECPWAIGVTAVHYGGLPVDLDRLYATAEENSLQVIEDAAHAITAKYREKPIGSTGQYICFSLNAKKPLPAGDGGILVVPQDDYEMAKMLRWFGIDRDTWARTNETDYKWEYDVPLIGYKYNPTDIVAAIAFGELDSLDWCHQWRRSLVNIYRENLSNVPGVTLLDEPEGYEFGCHLMVIRVDGREDLITKLNESNIEVGCHYMPNNMYSAFGGSPERTKEETPNAWTWGQTALTLPLHMDLKSGKVHHICKLIRGGW